MKGKQFLGSCVIFICLAVMFWVDKWLGINFHDVGAGAGAIHRVIAMLCGAIVFNIDRWLFFK